MSAQLLLVNHKQAICDHDPGLHLYPAHAPDLIDGIDPFPDVFVPSAYAQQVPVAASADALQVEDVLGQGLDVWDGRHSAGVADAAGQQDVLAVAAQHAVLAVAVDAV
jgi:hypothetical protein